MSSKGLVAKLSSDGLTIPSRFFCILSPRPSPLALRPSPLTRRLSPVALNLVTLALALAPAVILSLQYNSGYQELEWIMVNPGSDTPDETLTGESPHGC